MGHDSWHRGTEVDEEAGEERQVAGGGRGDRRPPGSRLRSRHQGDQAASDPWLSTAHVLHQRLDICELLIALGTFDKDEPQTDTF